MVAAPLVIEFGDDRCRNVFFAPLDRRMRGRFDAVKLAQHDRDAGELVAQWPEPLPGQRLEIGENEVAVLEPLQGNAKVESKLKARSLRLAPAREVVNCDFDTAAHYAAEAVKAGQAIIVSGTIPEYDAAKVRKDFIVKPPADPQAKLVDAINRQADAFDRLATALERAFTAKR